jgi:hypothetical protein
MNLTTLERKVLKALVRSSDGNGHDFGCIEDVRGVVGKAQLGALITSLQKKGVIRVYEPVRTESGLWTQFKLIDIEAAVAAVA